MQSMRSLSILLAVHFTSACAGAFTERIPAYPGPQRPREELAELHLNTIHDAQRVWLSNIDHLPLREARGVVLDNTVVEFLPGSYTLTVRSRETIGSLLRDSGYTACRSTGFRERECGLDGVMACDATFEAKAGRSYYKSETLEFGEDILGRTTLTFFVNLTDDTKTVVATCKDTIGGTAR